MRVPSPTVRRGSVSRLGRDGFTSRQLLDRDLEPRRASSRALREFHGVVVGSQLLCTSVDQPGHGGGSVVDLEPDAQSWRPGDPLQPRRSSAVLFIHGAIWADFLRPLAEQPAFSGFQRIGYHRRGYGESGGPAGGFDMQEADIVALLDHLKVDRAHLVGHSEGAMIAPVLAASYPDRVRSLALLEPLPSSRWLAASDFADLLGILGPAFEAMVGRYQAGDVAGVFDALFEPTGLDWRAAAKVAGLTSSTRGSRTRQRSSRAKHPHWSSGTTGLRLPDGSDSLSSWTHGSV
jgi:pimeloyl-ACP methyl ester carboxylesterase